MVDIYPYNQKSVQSTHAAMKEVALDELLSNYFGTKAAVVSSARAGIYHIIRQLGLVRTDHILIPDFLCRSVLYILNLQGFGVQQPNARTKAVFALHQWGYPQRMDIIMTEAKKRDWFVIEDCAHSFGSVYRGQMVGGFGDAAVVTFPKFFPTYVGGAILSKRDDILDSVRKLRLEPRSLGHRLFDRVSVYEARQKYLWRKPIFLSHAVYIKSIHFPRIASAVLQRFPKTLADLKSEVARRRYYFDTLKKREGGKYHPSHLEEGSEVVPLCVPMFFPDGKMLAAQQMLKEKNIAAEILHFDINRNILDPEYKKCLALPCHQQITEKELGDMCDVISNI